MSQRGSPPSRAGATVDGLDVEAQLACSVQIVECEGPHLAQRGYTRYAVLIRLERRSDGLITGYATAIAVCRPRAAQPTLVFFEGYSAEDISLAWERFADRIKELAFDLAAAQEPPPPEQRPRIIALRPRRA